jgi:hypothetical protein
MIKHKTVIAEEEMNEGSMAVIELEEGDFKGVQFKYGTMTFGEEDDEGGCELTFEFDVINYPDEIAESKDHLEKNEDFQNVVSNLLIDILEDFVENQDQYEEE